MTKRKEFDFEPSCDSKHRDTGFASDTGLVIREMVTSKRVRVSQVSSVCKEWHSVCLKWIREGLIDSWIYSLADHTPQPKHVSIVLACINNGIFSEQEYHSRLSNLRPLASCCPSSAALSTKPDPDIPWSPWFYVRDDPCLDFEWGSLQHCQNSLLVALAAKVPDSVIERAVSSLLRARPDYWLAVCGLLIAKAFPVGRLHRILYCSDLNRGQCCVQAQVRWTGPALCDPDYLRSLDWGMLARRKRTLEGRPPYPLIIVALGREGLHFEDYSYAQIRELQDLLPDAINYATFRRKLYCELVKSGDLSDIQWLAEPSKYKWFDWASLTAPSLTRGVRDYGPELVSLCTLLSNVDQTLLTETTLELALDRILRQTHIVQSLRALIPEQGGAAAALRILRAVQRNAKEDPKAVCAAGFRYEVEPWPLRVRGGFRVRRPVAVAVALDQLGYDLYHELSAEEQKLAARMRPTTSRALLRSQLLRRCENPAYELVLPE